MQILSHIILHICSGCIHKRSLIISYFNKVHEWEIDKVSILSECENMSMLCKELIPNCLDHRV